MRDLTKLFLAGAALLWAGAAVAGPLPQGGVTSKEVVNVMRGMKLPTDITTDKDGDPLIYSTSAAPGSGCISTSARTSAVPRSSSPRRMT